MKKSEFIKLAKLVIKERKRRDKANKHLAFLCQDGFYPPVLDCTFEDKVITMLDDVIGGEWFTWWLYADVKKVAWIKTKEYKVETLSQLWDFCQLPDE